MNRKAVGFWSADSMTWSGRLKRGIRGCNCSAPPVTKYSQFASQDVCLGREILYWRQFQRLQMFQNWDNDFYTPPSGWWRWWWCWWWWCIESLFRASFRAQPLESLSACSVTFTALPINKKGARATQPLERILCGKFVWSELGVVTPSYSVLSLRRRQYAVSFHKPT